MCTQGVSLLEIIYHLSKLNEQKRLSSTHLFLAIAVENAPLFIPCADGINTKNAASKKMSTMPTTSTHTASANDPHNMRTIDEHYI